MVVAMEDMEVAATEEVDMEVEDTVMGVAGVGVAILRNYNNTY
jgi:hypothetical protein